MNRYLLFIISAISIFITCGWIEISDDKEVNEGAKVALNGVSHKAVKHANTFYSYLSVFGAAHSMKNCLELYYDLPQNLSESIYSGTNLEESIMDKALCACSLAAYQASQGAPIELNELSRRVDIEEQLVKCSKRPD